MAKPARGGRAARLAACNAGRILDPTTARSQVIGAMTMGVDDALVEKLAVDEPIMTSPPMRRAAHADLQGLADEGKGVSAPRSSTRSNATGVRVRDYPITWDERLGESPYRA